MTQITDVVSRAMELPVDSKQVEVLRNELITNDFKPTFEAAQVFISGLCDLGMTLEEKIYWGKVSLYLL